MSRGNADGGMTPRPPMPAMLCRRHNCATDRPKPLFCIAKHSLARGILTPSRGQTFRKPSSLDPEHWP